MQLDLFTGDPDHGPIARRPGRGQPVRPAVPASNTRTLARELPPHLHLGTSSWSFPGWEGLVYDQFYPQARLAREGLAAYGQHPLFRTAGVDRTHYAPVEPSVFADYADAVPDDFRFLVKAHEACTLARFPEHARYGKGAGRDNPLFLDPEYATERVVGPFMEGLGPKAGPLLFQFAPQPMAWLGGAREFARRLHSFLAKLPRGPLYAVEVRNRGLLTEDYAQALADVGACPCINLLDRMPAPLAQWHQVHGNRAPALVVRWMLTRGLAYDQARARYHPFNAIVDPDPAAVQAIAHLVRTCAERPAYVIANNKAEGSAPLSLARLADALRDDEVPF